MRFYTVGEYLYKKRVVCMWGGCVCVTRQMCNDTYTHVLTQTHAHADANMRVER